LVIRSANSVSSLQSDKSGMNKRKSEYNKV
jgi:hypothetical protein